MYLIHKNNTCINHFIRAKSKKSLGLFSFSLYKYICATSRIYPNPPAKQCALSETTQHLSGSALAPPRHRFEQKPFLSLASPLQEGSLAPPLEN
jgi:hypothetical protein